MKRLAAKIKCIFQSIVDIADERVSLHGFPNRKLCVISIEKAKRIAIKYQVARWYTFVFSSFDSGTRSRRPWGIVTRFLLSDQIEHFWLIVHWLTSIFANQSRFSSRRYLHAWNKIYRKYCSLRLLILD